MRVAVIIPCINEQDYIGDVVKKAKSYVDEVVVVDNGSYDNTALEAQKNGAKVVYSHRKGMGATTGKGLFSVEADIYVTMDGDGQHNPDEIPNLIKPLLENKADLVVGIRMDDGSMPRYRKLVNDMFACIYNLGDALKLDDVQCGFRAFNKNVQELPIKSHGFGCVIELLVRCRKLKYRILPVPVRCIYHQSLKQNSTLNPIKHGLIALGGVIKWRLWEKIG
jgi:glycosyltransferase involved in cell wall biosynthesis